ncbi:sulfurtransferase [Shewanella psychropiezotolerans]|uniref:Sulfurtransferase n=2 Tax=Shewanella psychropiezotolerans TaxID=2593655 RepID=A0ABX5WVB3_9GAMM|nr:sulfurtransferase [Shewanella psychropiezotolerans]
MMIKKGEISSRFIRFLCISFMSVIFFVQMAFSADVTQFPLREKYRDIPTISHQDLYRLLDSTVLVDVRSKYEFDTLHIKNAVNISISNAGFITRLMKIRERDSRPIVFYCNGITCAKSYKACDKAVKFGIKDVSTFDLGIFGWTKAHPDAAVLLGESPVSLDKLIDDDLRQAHLLPPADFVAAIGKKVMVIDIREHFQRDVIILTKVTRVASSDKIIGLIKKAKKDGLTLLIYDAVGKQTRWLQYLLEKEGMKNYFFMAGGLKGYLEANLGPSEYD